MRRRKARELALKMLYQVEVNRETPRKALDEYCDIFPYQTDIVDYALFLLEGVEKEKKGLDERITRTSEHWKLERITPVDRNILRMGVFEMLLSPDVPPKVAIDEAIELGKKFGTADSKDFINGVLDRIFHDHYEDKPAGGGKKPIDDGSPPPGL